MSNKAFFVFSTLASDVTYQSYVKGGADLAVADKGVLIKGGAGVMNDRIITPAGVRTEVSAEELVVLQQDAVFQLHQRNGYITVEESAHDPDRVASDMRADDRSRQLTEGDFRQPDEDGPDPTASAGTAGKKKK
jgi:hypothetical protein